MDNLMNIVATGIIGVVGALGGVFIQHMLSERSATLETKQRRMEARAELQYRLVKEEADRIYSSIDLSIEYMHLIAYKYGEPYKDQTFNLSDDAKAQIENLRHTKVDATARAYSAAQSLTPEIAKSHHDFRLVVSSAEKKVDDYFGRPESERETIRKELYSPDILRTDPIPVKALNEVIEASGHLRKSVREHLTSIYPD